MSLKIKMAVAISLIFLLMNVVGEAGTASRCLDEEAVFRTGEYVKGVARLNSIIGKPDTDNEILVCALHVLAELYEDRVGDYERALLLYNKVTASGVPESNPVQQVAKDAVSRLLHLKKQNMALDKRLPFLKSRAAIETEREPLLQLVRELDSIIDDNDRYYRNHEIFYYKGVIWLKLYEYGRSMEAFNTALQLKPALDFYLPVTRVRDQASKLHKKNMVTNFATITTGILFCLAAGVFFFSKPRTWLRLKHIFFLTLILTCWYALFTLSFQWFASNSGALETIQQDPNTVLPVFVYSGPGEPGAEVAQALFRYGFIGIIVLFLFTTGIGRRAKRFTALVMNYLFAWLLFISVSALFYMHYCDGKSFYEAKQGSALNHINGNIYFHIDDPDGETAANPGVKTELKFDQPDGRDVQ